MLKTCPIAHFRAQQPKALALENLTYEELDLLVQKLTHQLCLHPEPLIAFAPRYTIEDIAFIFAIWRLKKAVYPMSFRLPKNAIEERCQKTGAKWVEPNASFSPLEITEINDEYPATYIETSSSERIVCHTLKSHFISATESAKALGLNSSSSYCLNLPLFHISGIAICMRTFTVGARLYLPHNLEKATHISMVPTQLFRQKDPLPHCQCLLLGGAPMNFASHPLPIYYTYGMTETASMIALKAPNEKTKILPHLEVNLSDEGEIFVRGKSLLSHYFGGEKHEGWLATKDIGAFKDGEFLILGRKDRQFISGGENIHPEEIEKALQSLSDILEAKVEPIPSVEYGSIPKATLYCAKPLSVQEIHKMLEQSLPKYKIPKEIEVSMHPLQNSKITKMSENLLRQGD